MNFPIIDAGDLVSLLQTQLRGQEIRVGKGEVISLYFTKSFLSNGQEREVGLVHEFQPYQYRYSAKRVGELGAQISESLDRAILNRHWLKENETITRTLED